MQTRFTGLIICLTLVLCFSFGLTQDFNNLVIAPEVVFDGTPPDEVFFKPGRILDDGTIWFCCNTSGLFSPDEIYGFRSVDGGKTFTYNETGMPGRASQMDAFDANTAIIATAEGKIFRTTDGGATWTEVYSYQIGSADGWFDGCRVLNDNVAVVYGDDEPNGNMHFVRTEDKGATWTEISGIDYLGAAYGYYTWGLAACNVGESIWCSATNTSYDSSFVFRSYDAGVTWDSFKIPVDVIPNYPRSIAFSDDNNGLIAARGGYLIKTTDGGETWTPTNNPDTSASAGSYVNGVTAIPGTNIIVALDDIGTYYTTDLGATWDSISTPAETSDDYFVSGVFSSTDMGYVFTYNGQVLRFENQVSSFDDLIIAPEVAFEGTPPDEVFFKPGRILDDGTIWFCCNTSGLFSPDEIYGFRSVDGGKTFTYNETGMPGRAAQMDAFDANTAIVATAEGKIFRTTDGGATWTEVYSYQIGSADGWFDGCRVLNENVAVVYGDDEPNGNMHFVRTEDKGATWTEISGIDYLGAAYGYYTWGLAASNVGESIWCSATNTSYDSSFVFRSYDAGVTWESFKIPVDVIPNYPRSIAFSDDNNGLIAARGGYLIKTTDGGETWTPTNNPDTSASAGSYVNGVTAIPGTNIIVALDDIGTYYTTDLGATWDSISTPAETSDDYFVSGVFASTDVGYVFTYNGQVLRFEGMVTDIGDQVISQKLTDFQLDQNYPNPFNPQTTISYQIPQTSEVELNIYNMLGQKIATLVSGTQTTGTYTVTWDGSGYASGVYLYRLTTDKGFSETKRLILLK